MNKGFLISVEGIDGSGKSTLARNLYQLFLERNLDVLLTKEPGATPLGKSLREILHTQKALVCDKSEFLLFAADRAQHFATVVQPALDQGTLVISDRMHDSSLAYQGFGRGLDKEIITSVSRWAMNNRMPDLTVYVTIDTTTAFERLHATRAELTSFEQEKIDFWQRVQTGFTTIFADRDNVVTLDGTLDQEILAQQAFDEIIKKL
jgi:dTMP kinase